MMTTTITVMMMATTMMLMMMLMLMIVMLMIPPQRAPCAAQEPPRGRGRRAEASAPARRASAPPLAGAAPRPPTGLQPHRGAEPATLARVQASAEAPQHLGLPALHAPAGDPAGGALLREAHDAGRARVGAAHVAEDVAAAPHQDVRVVQLGVPPRWRRLAAPHGWRERGRG